MTVGSRGGPTKRSPSDTAPRRRRSRRSPAFTTNPSGSSRATRTRWRACRISPASGSGSAFPAAAFAAWRAADAGRRRRRGAQRDARRDGWRGRRAGARGRLPRLRLPHRGARFAVHPVAVQGLAAHRQPRAVRGRRTALPDADAAGAAAGGGGRPRRQRTEDSAAFYHEVHLLRAHIAMVRDRLVDHGEAPSGVPVRPAASAGSVTEATGATVVAGGASATSGPVARADGQAATTPVGPFPA